MLTHVNKYASKNKFPIISQKQKQIIRQRQSVVQTEKMPHKERHIHINISIT